MTKIIQLQYATESAGSAAIRLHKAFLDAGIDSSVLSLHSSISGNPRITKLGKKGEIIARLDERFQRRVRKQIDPAFGLFSYPVLGSNVSQMAQILNADIIILHWVLHGFLSLKNIEQLIKTGKPVIFFMHDMWTVTGGCHYSFDCEKYKVKCYECPMFVEHKGKDWALSEFEQKKKIYSAYSNVYFVSPSSWLYECIKHSALANGMPAFHIPNVLDRNIFKPFEKSIAKQILNIGEDETVISFGAVYVSSPYKGWPYLQQALQLLKDELSDKKVTLLIFGSDYNQQIADAVPFKIKFMGMLKDEYSTAVVYNASDVFIAPSLADNLPYTIFEALSCGTPVVAFSTGGIPDMIQHKVNGYLANYKDASNLAEGVRYVLGNNISGSLSSEFDNDKTIAKHLELFELAVAAKS